VSFAAITLCVVSQRVFVVVVYFVIDSVRKLLDTPIGVLGFDSRQGLGIFLFTIASRTALGPTQAPIQWVPGALSLEVKRPGCEADHSPPLVPRSDNACRYTSNPPIRLHGVVLIKKKHRDNFTFTFTPV
jgi:hypothetical protein